MLRKFNYGYIVALVCFLIAFFYVGYANNSGSLYVVPVTEYYGFSRAEFSLIFSITSIVCIFSNLAFSFLYSRLGIRRIVFFAAILSSSAYYIYYKSTSLLQFYLGAFLFGIGYSYTNMLTFSFLINSWFPKKRGTILGLISAGSGFGGSVMSPLIGYVISVYGFKKSYLLTSIILFTLIIPIALFIKENTDYDHSEREEERDCDLNKKNVRDLLKEKSIILGLTAIFLMSFLMAPWLNVAASHLIDRGFDTIFASQILGGILFMLGLSKIFVGLVYDRIGINASINICLTSFIFSSVILLFVKSKLFAWLFALFFGISLSALSVLVPLFTSAFAGQEYLRDIIGIACALVGAGMSIGTPLVNLAYDLTGSNNLILIIFTILGIINILLSHLALKKPAGKKETLVS